MAWSMGVGSGFGLFYIVSAIKKKLDYTVFDYRHALLILQSFVFGILGQVELFWIKIVVFVPFLGLLTWALTLGEMVHKNDFITLCVKFSERLPWKKRRKPLLN